jgi:ribosomal protein L10
LKTKPPAAGIGARLKNLLSDKTTDTWKLLSETDYFLSRTGDYPHYEHQMRGLRSKLSGAGKAGKEKVIKEVHTELTALRKELRLAGHDLSLGKYRLVFDGFRHDDSLREGFRRLVLFLCEGFFLTLTGDSNHIDLAEILEQQITRHSAATGKRIIINGKHYLWYLRTKDELVLSGADTETKEDYAQLKAQGEVSSLLFLSRLKHLN